ncbi:MAG: hypothetical protein E7354_00895 [Clostridiales bacterium]|nr:hypothetical protein [Clostridiales bacterium]
MSEEIKNFGEQPSVVEACAVATGDEKEAVIPDGSPIGKFKNSETLLDAYNELQSEFTRKCQKLSETEKKLQEIIQDENSGNDSSISSNEFAWNKNIKEFLQSHKFANAFAEEITNELIKDENLRSEENGLEKAYLKVLDNNYVSPKALANDQNFLENHIYNNEEIKEKIIKEYVASLQNNQNPIRVSSAGYDRGVAGVANITSLEDAKKYVENMFRF